MAERRVTVLVRNGGAVLLIRRRRPDGSAVESWDGLTGSIEDDPTESARELIREAGFDSEALTLVRSGDPVTTPEREAPSVYPFLFDAPTRDGSPGDGIEPKWVSPADIARRETVAGLDRIYERVAPTLETIATDHARGAAALSASALRVLRDRAAALATDNGPTDANDRDATGSPSETSDDDWAVLAGVARDLRSARPSMVAIANRVNRAMASAEARTAAAVERAARHTLETALEADASAAAVAADRFASDSVANGTDESSESSGPRVLTLSRSGTVAEAIDRLEPSPREIVIAESRPGGEGIAVGEELASIAPVRLVADSGVAHALGDEDRPVDTVLVGADTISPEGTIRNKIGTRGVALAAVFEDVPVYVVAASAKVATEASTPDLEARDPAELYDRAALSVTNNTFDHTPAEAITGICTERGVLDPAETADLAAEFAAEAGWDDPE